MLRRRLTPLALLALAASAGACTGPSSSDADDPEALHVREVEAWRAERLAGLRRPDGWLTLVGLAWLAEGESTCGGDPSNDVVLPGEGVPAEVGVFRLQDGRVEFEAAPGAPVVHDGEPVGRLVLADDTEGEPTVLELGSLSFYPIRRGDQVGIRMKDSQSPALAAFDGIPSYPIRYGYRVVGRFEPYDPPRPVPVPTVLGTSADEPSPGAVAFELGGRTLRLDALPGGSQHEELFLVFGDETNRHETYGGGRFLDAVVEADGTVVLDFNKAYNPPCVFTPYATCPLPPPQNRLTVKVEAGEKRFGDH